MDLHASLFHIIGSQTKPYRKTAESETTLLGDAEYKDIHLMTAEYDVLSHESDGINLSKPQEDILMEEPVPAKDTQKNKGTHTALCSKSQPVSRSKSIIAGKRHKQDLKELPPARLLPYVILIHNCLPLPVPTIESYCISGEILCRIQYFTLKHRKQKLLPQSAPTKQRISKLQAVQGWQFVLKCK